MYRNGMLSQSDFVHDILLMLLDEPNNEEMRSAFDALEDDIKSAILGLLNELETKQFVWKPFVIGCGYNEAELKLLSQRVRSAFDILR